MRRTKKLLMGVVMLCMVLIGVIAMPRGAQAADSDFRIEDGVLWKYNGSGGDVIIPKGVIRIGSNAFIDCDSLTSVTIPDGVTDIGEQAFWRCNSLSNITIPSSVKSIGMYAFRDTPWLENKRQERTDHLVIVNHILVDGIKSDGNVIIPEDVTSIGDKAFEAGILESITIPEGVIYIGWMSFAGCENLKEMTILNPKANFANGNRVLDFSYEWTQFKNPIVIIKGYANSTAQKLVADSNKCRKDEHADEYNDTTFQFVPLDGTGGNDNPTTPDNPEKPDDKPTTPSNPTNPQQPTKPQQPANPITPTKPLTQEQKTYKLLQKVKATKSMTIKKGKSKTITVTLPKGLRKVTKFSGKKVNQIKITFKSSNKKVATVNSKGKVTAKKKGTAKIKIYLSVHDGKGVSVRGLTVKVKVK